MKNDLMLHNWGGSEPSEYNYLLTVGYYSTDRTGYSDGTKDSEDLPTGCIFGKLEPATLPYFYIGTPPEGHSRLFIDTTEEIGGYININGVAQKLTYSNPGYEVKDSIRDYILDNIDNTIPIYYSRDVPPPNFIDYATLPNRNDTYKLEISFDNPCQYIRFINITPDTETGSYFNYSCERIGEKQYQVVFNAYGALVQYNANMMLLAFSITDNGQNIFDTFASLMQTDMDQAESQASLLSIDPPTNMSYHYEKVIDTPVELDMTMYKDYVDISKIATASDDLLVFPD